ncbi:MAG TPA: hypothetical protein VF755_05970 [Catenuloplanes sp.]
MSLSTAVRDVPSVTERRHTRQRTSMTVATAVIIVATVGLTLLLDHRRTTWLPLALLVAACALAPALATGPRRPPAGVPRGAAGRLRELLLQMAPVILLSAAFPVATQRMLTSQVGDAPLTVLLLASSLTVPWLSQIVCMPLFNGLWELTGKGDPRGLAGRVLDTWPAGFAAALPVVALFAVPMGVVMRWGAVALLCYLALATLHLTFAQALVFAIANRDGTAWAVGWAAYAATLVAAPTAWYAPPLVGIATQIGYLWHAAGRGPRPTRVAGLGAILAKGALLGSLLWCDKYLYFLRWHRDFDAGLVFAAMIPAIVAYNYYFIVHAPRVDTLVGRVRHAMEHEPLDVLRAHSDALTSHIESSAAKAAFLAALLGFGAVLYLGLRQPATAALVGAMVVASWCFVMASLLCYKLTYIGRPAVAYRCGALHLCLVAVAFAVGPTPAAVYTAISVADLALVGYLVRACLGEWRAPEYALFWRHATRW